MAALHSKFHIPCPFSIPSIVSKIRPHLWPNVMFRKILILLRNEVFVLHPAPIRGRLSPGANDAYMRLPSMSGGLLATE